MFENITKKEILQIKEGDNLFYKSNLMEHPGATYYAKVVQVCKRHIVLRVQALQDTIVGDTCFGPAVPYCVSVIKSDIGISHFLSKKGVPIRC